MRIIVDTGRLNRYLMTVPQNLWWITDKLDAGQRKEARMDTKTIDNMVSLHRVKEKI